MTLAGKTEGLDPTASRGGLASAADSDHALRGFLARVAELAPAGLVGLAVYVAWARALRLPELDAALELVRTLTGRGRGVGRKPARG